MVHVFSRGAKRFETFRFPWVVTVRSEFRANFLKNYFFRGRYTNVSVNSKPDHTPGDPRGFAPSHCPGVGFSPNFLCQGGRGFESEKFPTKQKNFSIGFKETGAA